MEKLLWIDMEITGLDVSKERIIEVAAIVTDMNFNKVDSYHSVVFQPQEFLDRMDEWNQNQHSKTGLVDKIPQAPKVDKVESELCTFVKKYFNEPAILAGNSIGQDRKFIDCYMKDLAKLLHYRMLDVTAWKLIMNTRYNVSFDKKETHRALDDIEESILEMKTFTDYIDKTQS